MSNPCVFAHIVTFNNARTIERCLAGLSQQSGFTPGRNLSIHVTDNASHDGTPDYVRPHRETHLTFEPLSENIGFCAGHNRGVATFLKSGAAYLLILNPDLRLERGALQAMVDALEKDPAAGLACPKLLRANGALDPVEPRRLDAAGMYLTPALRHFDRGSNELDTGAYDKPSYVFGGSGACLLIRRAAVEALLVDSSSVDTPLEALYPFLRAERGAPLFDEAFFAYREDADLAWRAQLLGVRCRYVPTALGYHERVVTPERRATLPPLLNRLGVRNRFLLQLNNFIPAASLQATVYGMIVRNIIVLLALPLRERSSLGAIGELFKLLPRALYRRRLVMERAQESPTRVARWFSIKEEPCP